MPTALERVSHFPTLAHVIERLSSRPAWAWVSGTLTAIEERLARRWIAVSALLVLGFVVVFPTLIVLPPDDEGLFTDVESTVFRARYLFDGYPFWNPFVGLGVPHPLSENLTFHPILLLFRFASPGVSLAVLYLVQIWIGLLSVCAVCRYLGLRPWISLLSTLTFALSSVTITYLHDFWPAQLVEWTLSPLLLLLVLKLLDCEQAPHRLGYALSAGLCAGLIMLNGHAGVYPYIAIGMTAFLAGSLPRIRRVWPWLGVAFLVFALTGATKLYDVGLEAVRGDALRPERVYGMDFWRLLFYPIGSPFPHGEDVSGDRLLAVGGPFLVLTLIGLLLYRKVSQRHAHGLRVAVVVCFIAWFLPVPLVSGNWYARDPFTLFCIFLAGLTLQTLWDAGPRRRAILLAAAGLQVAALVAGYSTYYRQDLARAAHYIRGQTTPSLQNILENQELYAYFEQRADRRSTRIYMAPKAEERLWRSLESLVNHNQADNTDYEFAGWALHNLRLVNGHFKGTDLTELQPPPEALHSELRAEPTFPKSSAALDVLNIGYVLAVPDEQVSTSLIPLRTFRLADSTVIEVYRNPRSWPDAVMLAPRAKQIMSLPARAGCTDPGLMCTDFSVVRALRLPSAIEGEQWRGTRLDVQLAASSAPSVLMLSQLYRPGWKAHLSNGQTVNGYRLFGGLTGFDLPAGVRTAKIVFQPTARIILASVAWATIILSLLLIGVAAFRARRAGRG